MRLTRNFSLAELTVTSTGLPNLPGEAELRRLSVVAYALQCIRDVVGRLSVTSGFRSPEVNEAVGGSASSAHMRGLAADIIPLDMPRMEVYHLIRHMAEHGGLCVDQVIVYEDKPHIHLGLRLVSGPRRQFLVHTSGRQGGQEYVPWDRYDGVLRARRG